MRKGIALLVIALFAVTIATPFLTEDSSAATSMVNFNMNGGGDTVTPATVSPWEVTVNEFPALVPIDSTYTTMNPERITSEGGRYVFAGWNTDPDAVEGLEYVEISNVTTTLYAIWLPGFNITGTLIVDGKPFNENGMAAETYAWIIVNDKTYRSSSIGNDGIFSVTVPSEERMPDKYGVPTGPYYIGFHTFGHKDILNYKIQSVPKSVTYNDSEINSNKKYVISMDGTETWDSIVGKDYEITDVSSKSCFVLYYLKETATVSGKITNKDNYVISGAKVEILDGLDNTIIYVHSDNSEYTNYKIEKCPVGSYKIRITSLNYETLESTLTVTPEGIEELNFYLTAKPVTTYFGLDLPHFLMVSGTIVATLLFLSALIVRRRARRNPSFLDNKEE